MGVRHPNRIPSDRIFAVVNCNDVALSAFLLPCFNTLPDIFAVMNCFILGDH